MLQRPHPDVMRDSLLGFYRPDVCQPACQFSVGGCRLGSILGTLPCRPWNKSHYENVSSRLRDEWCSVCGSCVSCPPPGATPVMLMSCVQQERAQGEVEAEAWNLTKAMAASSLQNSSRTITPSSNVTWSILKGKKIKPQKNRSTNHPLLNMQKCYNECWTGFRPVAA